jgi:hypothetical protein
LGEGACLWKKFEIWDQPPKTPLRPYIGQLRITLLIQILIPNFIRKSTNMSAETTQTFTCPVCAKDFTNANALRVHKQRSHRDAIEESYHEKKVFACHVCQKVCADNKDLRRHVSGCEKKEKRKGKKEDSNMMGPPRARKTKGDDREEEKVPAGGKGGHCMKSKRHSSAWEKEVGFMCVEGPTQVTLGLDSSSVRSSSVEGGMSSDYDL